jgi:uncharacterized cupredoxin-like copper-binding protein
VKPLAFSAAVALGLAALPAIAHSPAGHGHHGHAPQGTHGHGSHGHGSHGYGSHAHGSHAHAAPIEGGAPGKAADATRTVTVIARDTEFSPARISVKAGETVRLVVRNEGKLVHELTIGTKSMQLEHQSEMLAMAVSGALGVDKIDRAKIGNHDHGNNVLLEPGETGEVVWTFAKAADLEFGCNVPGHYDQGMKGAFVVE